MPLSRRRSVQIFLFLAILWLVVATILGVLSGDYVRSLWLALIILGAAFGVVGAVVLASVLPSLIPQLALMIVARRERFWPPGFFVWNYRLARQWTPRGLRWQFVRASIEPVDLVVGPPIPMDDRELRERLIRLWGILPLSSGLAVLASIPLMATLGMLWEGNVGRDLFRLLLFLALIMQASVFVGFIREDIRSPRSIVRLLRADDVAARREVAYAALNGYSMLERRPREYDRDVMTTVRELLLEVPTAHFYRYMLFRHLLDTEATEENATERAIQRQAVLGLEAHLRREPPAEGAELVVWYAAYLSSTAEELARIRSWTDLSEPGLAAAELWLRAREKELSGEFAQARALAEEARQRYTDELYPGTTLAFEHDQLARFLERLPPPEPDRPA